MVVVYRAKSFTDDDRDIGFLALKAGGRELLGALQVTLGLPSISVIQRGWQLCHKCVQSTVLATN